MKTKLKRVNPDPLKEFKSASAKRLLKHILSPLELAAIYRAIKPFNYKLENGSIYISLSASNQLLQTSLQKVRLLSALFKKDNLSKDIPFKLKEVFDDPKIILALTPHLRNRLCRLECYSMFSIMQKGRGYFIDEQKFGKRSMETLDGLFVKYGCGKLFN